MHWKVENRSVWIKLLHWECDRKLNPLILRWHNRKDPPDKDRTGTHAGLLRSHCLLHSRLDLYLHSFLPHRPPFELETEFGLHLRFRNHQRAELEHRGIHVQPLRRPGGHFLISVPAVRVVRLGELTRCVCRHHFSLILHQSDVARVTKVPCLKKGLWQSPLILQLDSQVEQFGNPHPEQRHPSL